MGRRTARRSHFQNSRVFLHDSSEDIVDVSPQLLVGVLLPHQHLHQLKERIGLKELENRLQGFREENLELLLLGMVEQITRSLH